MGCSGRAFARLDSRGGCSHISNDYFSVTNLSTNSE